MRRISVLILLAALSGVLLLSSCFPAWKPGEEQTSIREEVTTPGQENPPEPPNPYEMRLVNEITLENLPKSERTKELKNLTFSSSFLSSSLTHDSRVLDSIRDSYQLASHVRIYNLQQQKQWLTIEYMQKIDDSHLLLVFGMRDLIEKARPDWEEFNEAYCYVVFRRTAEEQWVLTTEYYMCTKTLSSKDFDVVQVGDSATKVGELEPSVRFELARAGEHLMFPATSVSSPASPTVCWLLLSDGVLELEFQSDFSQKQERDMAYLSDYSLVSKTFHPYGSTEERFSILRSKVPVELPEGIPGRAK